MKGRRGGRSRTKGVSASARHSTAGQSTKPEGAASSPEMRAQYAKRYLSVNEGEGRCIRGYPRTFVQDHIRSVIVGYFCTYPWETAMKPGRKGPEKKPIINHHIFVMARLI